MMSEFKFIAEKPNKALVELNNMILWEIAYQLRRIANNTAR
jgi:hypothetical protein